MGIWNDALPLRLFRNIISKAPSKSSQQGNDLSTSVLLWQQNNSRKWNTFLCNFFWFWPAVHPMAGKFDRIDFPGGRSLQQRHPSWSRTEPQKWQPFRVIYSLTFFPVSRLITETFSSPVRLLASSLAGSSLGRRPLLLPNASCKRWESSN